MKSADQAAWDERYSGPELVWGAGPNQFVADIAAPLTPGRAIDLGTGEGRNAIWLAENGWDVTAVDFSRAGLDRARRLAAERLPGGQPASARASGEPANGERLGAVEWVHADLLEYQPAPGRYDLVLVVYIQLPAASLARVIRGAANAVAPGGTLLVVGHDLDNLSRGYGGPQDPDVLYTAAAIASELGELRVVSAGQVDRHVRTADGTRVAIDTLVRAERPELVNETKRLAGT